MLMNRNRYIYAINYSLKKRSRVIKYLRGGSEKKKKNSVVDISVVDCKKNS